ncbi:hypothetical protein MN116_007431 [Schistosoma mekongi]|uniref:Uncharacterized protein n=1 Tax=Schistosoma mekongi TaxID=38744 RepID=A0AAE2D3M1_SCHME|nr:hypothetical protein MN116_007431 [Schistosoma mekongi]
MASDMSESQDNKVDIEEVYKQVQKICENYKLFIKSDNPLNELYSDSLNLSYIRDDYETIKRELSIIKANRQLARDALLASGFQCPDDLSKKKLCPDYHAESWLYVHGLALLTEYAFADKLLIIYLYTPCV